MPSGKIHDHITIYTAAASLPVWFLATGGADPAAYVAGLSSYLFSGIWLSGDLDTNSSAYKRWGPAKIVWWPYRILVPHRSWLSHGIAIGPLLRAVYFAFMVWAVAHLLLAGLNVLITPVDERGVLGRVARNVIGFCDRHRHLALWALGGLILGGVTHSLLDGVVTRTKKLW